MGIQRTAVAFVALALAVSVLAGCVSRTPVPPPPTQEEIDAMRQAQAQDWWDSMSTGTTMPDVEMIEQLPPDEAYIRQTECLDEAQLPGVTVRGPGEWSFDGVFDDPAGVAVQMQQWVCSQQYPAEENFDWMLSPSQLEWLYDFYRERHLPCLRALGIEALAFPSREAFLAGSFGFPAWLPYHETVRPTPTTDEWERLAQRCPLPEMLHDYGLPGYTDQN